MKRHTLDIHPEPSDKDPLFINEPWLIDQSLTESSHYKKEPEEQEDNVRVYLPLDLNKNAFLRRLDQIIAHYEVANEDNEFLFQSDVEKIISQVEIYDQVWYARHFNAASANKHSLEGISVIKEIITRLEAIPDGCAEMFPFELIDTLQEEYI